MGSSQRECSYLDFLNVRNVREKSNVIPSNSLFTRTIRKALNIHDKQQREVFLRRSVNLETEEWINQSKECRRQRVPPQKHECTHSSLIPCASLLFSSALPYIFCLKFGSAAPFQWVEKKRWHFFCAFFLIFPHSVWIFDPCVIVLDCLSLLNTAYNTLHFTIWLHFQFVRPTSAFCNAMPTKRYKAIH